MKNIMKETFIAIALLALSTSSYAQSACAPCGEVITNADMPADAPNLMPYTNYVATASSSCRNPNNYFGGFYLGAAYGLGETDYHLALATSSPAQIDNATRSYTVVLANGGFDLVLNYFSIGVEVGYNYRSRNNPTSYFNLVDNMTAVFVGADPLDDKAVSVGAGKVRFDITSQHAGTLDILPGVAYKRFTAYFRLGVEEAKYKLQRRASFPIVVLDEGPGFDEVVDIEGQEYLFSPQKKNITGYRVGLGFGVAASTHISFHLNYIHTFANSQSFTPNVNNIIPPVILPVTSETTVSFTNLASKINIEPQRNELNFGVRFTL